MSTSKFMLPLLLALVALSCKETTTIYQPVIVSNDQVLQPKVAYTYPPANSVGPYDKSFSTALTVRFNKAMDPLVLPHAVHLSSPGARLWQDTAYVSSVKNSTAWDVISVSPLSPPGSTSTFHWELGKSYTLWIDAGAKDIYGNTLAHPYSMTFTPEPFFRVKYVYPANGTTGASRQPTIELVFNNPVGASLLSAITMTPPVPGRWRFVHDYYSGVDSTSIYLDFTRPLLVGEMYSIAIASGTPDESGHSLPAPFSSSFVTSPFGVTDVYPSNGAVDIPVTWRTFRFTFNDSLDGAAFRAALHVSPEFPSIITISPSRLQVNLTPAADLLRDTTYTITFDSTLRSRSGAKMPAPYVYQFSTVGQGTPSSDFVVQYTNPADGDTNVLPDRVVAIDFTNEPDTSTMRSAFSISPPTAGLLGHPYTSRITFSPISSFVPGTAYTVTLGTGLRSKAGAPLAQPYTFSFTTQPLRISSTYPSDGQTQVIRSYAISIGTNALLDTGAIRNAFSISPAVNGYFSFSSPTSSFSFYASPGFSPLTVYTVTIATTLKSQNGASLPAPYQFTFATGS